MTAFAMIIGMIPMALGLGEGAEQNAPLGRAVIGGLLFATVSTLFFVPVVFAGIHTPPRAPSPQRATRTIRAGGDGTDKRQRHAKTAAPDHGDAGTPAKVKRRLTEMTEKTHASLAIPTRETEEGHVLPPRHREWKRAKIAICIVLLLLAVGARAHGRSPTSCRTVPSRRRTQQNAQAVRERRRRRSRPIAAARRCCCRARLRGYVESPISARSTGYLLHWYADIGTQREARASCSPNSTRPKSIRNSRRRSRSASRPVRVSTSPRARSNAGSNCVKRDAVSQQELDERAEHVHAGRRQSRRRRRQRPAPAAARIVQARSSRRSRA